MTHTSAQHCQLISYDVRIWRIVAYRGKTTTTYSFRWRVGGHRHSRTFITARLADSFRAQLVTAAATGEAFDPDSGLPLSIRPVVARSWFEHAHDFAAIKWPDASPRHRKGTAEALASLTIALSTEPVDTPTASQQRHALVRYAFNTTAQCDDPTPALASELRWVEAHSLPLTAPTEPAHLRRALHAISVKLDGAPAAPATLARKRATFHAAWEYAVELGLLPANPLTRCRRTHRPASGVVDRRTVVNPDQARTLIGAVNVTCAPLEAYFACLYFAGLRPGEARELRVITDCDLPPAGWGELLLSGSRQAAGAAWTDPVIPTNTGHSNTATAQTPDRSRHIPNSWPSCGATSSTTTPDPTGTCSSPASAPAAHR